MQLNVIAHIYLTVSDIDAGLSFYEKLLEFFETQCLVKTDAFYYCAGGRTGLCIRRAAAQRKGTPFDPYRSGLHRPCFRTRSHEAYGPGSRLRRRPRCQNQPPAPQGRRNSRPRSPGMGGKAPGPGRSRTGRTAPWGLAPHFRLVPGWRIRGGSLGGGVRNQTNGLCFCGLLLKIVNPPPPVGGR